MEVLWEGGGWRTPREVRNVLENERQLAYTTVMTILVRLCRKGLVDRHKAGRSFVYHARHTREEWAAQRMGDLLGVADNRFEALSYFVASMDEADLEQLRRLLKGERQ